MLLIVTNAAVIHSEIPNGNCVYIYIFTYLHPDRVD